MKIYFARPQSMYSSPQDDRDLNLIKNLFPDYEIVDPNTEEHHQGFQNYGMDYVLSFIDSINIIIFRAFPDGSIGAGVWKEIKYGLEHYIEILELPVLTEKRVLSVNDARECLKICGNI